MFLFLVLIIRYTDPGVLTHVFAKLVKKPFGIVQNAITKRPEIIHRVMEVIFGHFGITERCIVGKRTAFFDLHLFGLTERGIENMDLTTFFQMRKAEVEDLLCRGKMLEGGGKDDDIETAVVQ